MKFLADENVPLPIVEMLSEKLEIRRTDLIMKGATDREILEYAAENNFVILTFDDDFTRFKQAQHPGILYIATRENYSEIVETVTETINVVDSEDLKNEIFIISP
jgi:predicted nuclease of predicted toxin-antitoxin system